ncbi:VOC family protein [Kitasatospora sp. MAP5-34]|uniref:VOC family protein n=1 Tax=Kitasatospora sp. MAP5-34 TaxID=3035102 RepID=UPI0024733927|nr:VOC family protein [Kitasatospora sp. MAP5-34]MDH6577216.1 putative enzyme related to lactoylglutathione lyase [Kitasatospora sp. MAP5-34]
MKITEPTVGGPCWVELGTSDPAAAKQFYGELFGWRAETDPNPEAGGYTSMMLDTAPVAGLTALYAPGQPTAWTVSFATAAVDATVVVVTAAGGHVLMEPMEVLDLGRFAVVQDSSGAAFSLWQARTFKGVGLLNEPGSLGWVELATRDPAGAVAFYTRVFGWSVNEGETYTQWGLDGRDFGGMLDMGDRFPPEVPPYWMPYFAVADVDLTAERAAALGATVMLPPVQLSGGPRLAVIRDAQGAAFGVHLARD